MTRRTDKIKTSATPVESSSTIAGVVVEGDVTDEVTDQVTVGEVTNDNDAVDGFVVEIAKDETGSIVKAEAPITTAPMTVVVADASEAAEHQPETSVVVASAAAAASEAAAMQGVTLISSDNVEEHQQVVEHQIMVMGSGGENEAVLEPGPDEVLIQIMTPDGQIVTTTSKQSDLVQSLQLEQGGGQELVGEQTYVLQSATTGGDEQIHQFQMIGVEEGGLEAVVGATGETVIAVSADELGGGSLVPSSRDVTRRSMAVTNEEPVISQSGVAFQCPACPRTFDKHNAFYGHLRSHKGVIFRCDRDPLSCHEEFAALAALRKHQREAHDIVKEFKCDKCTRSFDKESDLQTHVARIHDASRPYACKLCPKSFHKRSDLKQHLRLHLGIKRNCCKVCGRAFAHLSNLYRHMKVHGEGGNFVCGECGQQFLKIQGLNQHMRTHENSAMASLDDNLDEVEKELLQEANEFIEEEEYNPDEDEEERIQVTAKQRIKRERDADIVEKPVEEQDMIEEKEVADDKPQGRRVSRFAGKCFVCKVCGENFKNEGVAKAHLRSSHTLNEKQFLCRKCGAIFKTEKECRTHLQREHLKAMKLLETQTSSPSVKKGLDLIDSPALRRREEGQRRKSKAVLAAADPKTTCKVCGRDCKTGPFLNLHLKEHVKTDQLICKLCRRDCKTLDILTSHTCGTDKVSKRSNKMTLNMFDLECLDKFVSKLSDTKPSEVPAEIVVNLPEDQLAIFTRPDVQKKIEKLRDVSTVSLNVKTKEEMEKEREKEGAESGGGVPGGDEESDEYDSEAEGEPTLEEMEEFATRKIGLKTATATAASSHPYTAANVGVQNIIPAGEDHDDDDGDGGHDFDRYMEYLPEKADQDARLMAMADVAAARAAGRPSSFKSPSSKPSTTPIEVGGGGKVDPSLEESVVLQTVPVDKPESIIQIQPMKTNTELKKESTQGSPAIAKKEADGDDLDVDGTSEGGETVLPDDGPPDAVSPSVAAAAAADDSSAEAGEQFFKVVNMPAITDNEAMITISTDDGANWVVMAKEERSQEEEGKAVKQDRGSSSNSADESSSPAYWGAQAGTKSEGPIVPVGRKVKRTFTGPKAPLFINEPFTKRSRLAEETGEGDKTIREAPSKKIDSDLQTPNEADSRTGTKDNVVPEFDAAPVLSKDNLKELKKSESGKYPCSICSHEFTRQESLFQHMGLHDDSLAIKCDLCDMKFAWKSTLRKHKMTVHEGKILCLPCTEPGCTRTFKSFGHRKIHIKRDHEKQRDHECEECGKKFFLKDDLRTHSRIHTGLKPFACNICGKTFKHISHRNRHQQISHSTREDRPYNCEICKKGFVSKTQLVTHFRRYHHDLGAHQVDKLLNFMLVSKNLKAS